MNNSASASRRTWNRVMNTLVWASAVLVIVLVAGILGMVLVRGIPHISWKFLTTTASVLKGTDGILPAILNTLYVILLTLLIVLPLGVGAAVYLTEYAQNRKVISVIEFTNETLAGIPSIIYGLVGMLVFAQTLGFQTCLLSGSLTLVIMNLPTIIRTTQESLKTVPQGYREGALGLGAGKWHIIRTIVLPCSIDGIVTGCILAVGRIVGESAALLFTAGAAEVIAKSFARIFYRNSINIGLPIMECPEAVDAISAGDTVSVDFTTGLITDETTGKTFQAEPFPPFIQKIIADGGLMKSLTKK